MRNIQTILLTIILLFVFTGCANKINVDTIKSNEVNVENRSQSIYVNVTNSTDENIYLMYDINQGLEREGYTIAKTKNEANILLDVQIVFADSIDKNSTTKDILKNINFNIGLGGSSGNFSIYTKIGTTLGRILSDNWDSTMYQVVVDINIIFNKTNENKKSLNQQLISTAPLDGNEKQKVIYMVEEELTQSILSIF